MRKQQTLDDWIAENYTEEFDWNTDEMKYVNPDGDSFTYNQLKRLYKVHQKITKLL
jgi:hypothetical protein